MRNIRFVNTLLAAMMLFAGTANAHVELYDASPAANSMLESAPEELFLSFSGDVRMVKLTINDAKGNDVKFGFKPVMEATDEMRWPLPALAPGKYTVHWKVMGEDGHSFKSRYNFHVHDSHSHHNAH